MRLKRIEKLEQALTEALNTSETRSDSSLVKGCLDGKKECFGELMKKYAPKLMRFVLSRMNNKDYAVAEDIVQESFYQAYRSLNQCTNPDGFRSWIFKITWNRLAEYFRAKTYHSSLSLDNLEEDLLATMDTSNPMIDSLRKALATLTQEARLILFMKHTEGMTCAEIAKEVNMKPNTVAKILSRTYQKLGESILLKEKKDEL